MHTLQIVLHHSNSFNFSYSSAITFNNTDLDSLYEFIEAYHKLFESTDQHYDIFIDTRLVFSTRPAPATDRF